MLGRQAWRVYVISFCATSETALPWLHYGRSGSGVAIGFNSEALDARTKESAYRLCPVLYDQDTQIKWLRSIVTTVDDALAAELACIPADGNRDLLVGLALSFLANQIWMVLPRMKNPAFSGEAEWRLVAHVPKGLGVPEGGDDPVGPTSFRTAVGRIVPCKVLILDVLPVVEIVLGASAPMQEDPLALRVLIEETLANSDDVEVSDSIVPVRP